jgi:hypothetical protein
MDKYVLLGTYDSCDRNNVEIIAYSGSIDELNNISKAIDKINELLIDKDRDNPSAKIKAFIEEHLSEIDILDSMTDYVQNIKLKEIYELKLVM